jgi:enoyl-CoA hydratase
MSCENVLLERDGRVAVITISRRQALNALNSQAVDGLRRAVLEVRHDPAIGAVIITGAGEKAFVSGADIEELSLLAATDAKEHALRGQHVLELVENMGKPVIAAINGYALGGGCELAMACTLRVAADTARLGQPETKLGIIPGYAGTQRLSRLVGKGRAMELILTGRMVDAQEALAIGLVNKVVPAGELMKEARALADALAAGAPLATRYIIEAINNGLEMPFAEACFLEATLFGLVFSTEDKREGTRAFLEKRKPVFKGK